MTNKTLKPVIGEWYITTDSQERFEVVAIDKSSRTIDIQYFNGDISEIDFDNWHELGLEGCPAPEDWSGPYDEIEWEDMDDDIEAMRPEYSDSPLEGEALDISLDLEDIY